MSKVTRRGFVAALAGLAVARPAVSQPAIPQIAKATFQHWQPSVAQVLFYKGHPVIPDLVLPDHALDALRYSITQMEATNPILAAIKRRAAADRGITS